MSWLLTRAEKREPAGPRDGHAVAGARNLDVLVVCNSSRGAHRRGRQMTEAEDRLRAVGGAMRYGRDAAAHAERCDRSSDRRPVGMRRDAADDAQHALAERKGDLALRCRRIVDEAIDDQRRVGADVEGRLVDEQHLHAAGRGGLDLLVLDDLRPDLDDAGRRSGGRRAGGGRVDGARRADRVGAGRGGYRENRAERGGGEQRA